MIKLKHGTIGEDGRLFLIAEVGSNWESKQDCLDSIYQASKSGAQAVKFQLFTNRDLYGPWEPECEVGVSPHLDPEWLMELRQKADECGIEFMCSAFETRTLLQVNAYVRVHKVASSELTHLPLLQEISKTGKPCILSTGASGLKDIEVALVHLHAHNKIPVVLLHCVVAYPPHCTNLKRLGVLMKEFPGCKVGYSDHSSNYDDIPAMAASLGACVLEKHVKLREMETPDNGVAITFDQMRYMVNYVGGNLMTGYTHEENDALLMYNRRLVATRTIREGDDFQLGVNMDALRVREKDGDAYSPFVAFDIAKRYTCSKLITPGEVVGPSSMELRKGVIL